MDYYLGAYFILVIKEANYGRIKGQKLLTCSTCINESLLDSWSYSWSTTTDEELIKVKDLLQIEDASIHQIQSWVDDKFNDKLVGWINTFSSIDVAYEYKAKFFPHLAEAKIFSIYFQESEANNYIDDFKPDEGFGTLGIWDNLQKRILEQPDTNEKDIGFDLIGVENGGDFHSFHCHDLAEDLKEKFNVKINKYGLLENRENWQEIINFMNDDKNGFEPVPWYLVKVKILNSDS